MRHGYARRMHDFLMAQVDKAGSKILLVFARRFPDATLKALEGHPLFEKREGSTLTFRNGSTVTFQQNEVKTYRSADYKTDYLWTPSYEENERIDPVAQEEIRKYVARRIDDELELWMRHGVVKYKGEDDAETPKTE